MVLTAIVRQDDDSGIGDIGATGSTQQLIAFLRHQHLLSKIDLSSSIYRYLPTIYMSFAASNNIIVDIIGPAEAI
jgi:hypothetical protein